MGLTVYMGPIIWNSLPNTIKISNGIQKFKNGIKDWGYDSCDFLKKLDAYYNSIK